MSSALGVLTCRAAPPGMTDVEEMVARSQIEDLLSRYTLTHTSGDVQGYASLFTEDADLLGVKGRDAILRMAQGEADKMYALGVSTEGDYKFGFMRSHVFNPVIDIIDATHARSISFLQVVVPDIDKGSVPTILFEGTYLDEYRKVGGKWLFSKRRSAGNSLMKDPGLGAKLGLGPNAAKPKVQQ
ncbi:MAG TPA: nuclear transport factor 2 family protein [Steroidobacteraceae bacterium]|nr:nuclear transport factor 2 family protein [Steroidobacteraceae bacterium]